MPSIVVSMSLQVTGDDENTGSSVQAPVSYQGVTTQNVSGGPNPGTVSVTTSDTVINFGGLTTLGIAWMKILEDSNTVEWGPESGGAIVVAGILKPGDPPTQVRLKQGTTYRWRAVGGTCKVRLSAYND